MGNVCSGKLRAMRLVDLDARHAFALGVNRDDRRLHFEILVRLVRQHLAEPSNRRKRSSARAPATISHIVVPASEHQRHAQRHQKRPRRGRRQMDRAVTASRPRDSPSYVLDLFHHRPMMYTTVKTTTQTASTKCQYSASTFTRSACVGFSLPRQRKDQRHQHMISPTITCDACSPTSE